MKQIVMLVGIGNNDRGSARLASEFGRTILVQDGPVTHEEIWENGARVFNGPELRGKGWRLLSMLPLDLPGIWRNLQTCRRLTRGEKVDLIIASAYVQAAAAL